MHVMEARHTGAPRLRSWARLSLQALLPLVLLGTTGCMRTAGSVTVTPPPSAAKPAPPAAPVHPAAPRATEPRHAPAPVPAASGVPKPVPPAPNAATGVPARGAASVAALGAASVAMLDASRRHAAAGDLTSAAADIERALTYEPSQPRLWLELADIRLRQGQREQARNLARRAQTLIGSDAALAARAAELLRRAGG